MPDDDLTASKPRCTLQSGLTTWASEAAKGRPGAQRHRFAGATGARDCASSVAPGDGPNAPA